MGLYPMIKLFINSVSIRPLNSELLSLTSFFVQYDSKTLKTPKESKRKENRCKAKVKRSMYL